MVSKLNSPYIANILTVNGQTQGNVCNFFQLFIPVIHHHQFSEELPPRDPILVWLSGGYEYIGDIPTDISNIFILAFNHIKDQIEHGRKIILDVESRYHKSSVSSTINQVYSQWY